MVSLGAKIELERVVDGPVEGEKIDGATFVHCQHQ